MKRKICATLLSLCSLVGGAERKSDASIVGKVLKCGSATVGSFETLCAASAWIKWIKHIIDLKVRDAKEAKNVTNQIKNPKYEYGYELQTPYFNIADIRIFTVGVVLCDLLCYVGYKSGQYLDKDKENEKSNINSGKEGSKKTVPDKDKKPTLNENSQKSKI